MMPGYTYLSDSEADSGRTVPDDSELNSLLQEALEFNDGWRVLVRALHMPKRMFLKPSPPTRHYTLYWYTGVGIEYQVINFSTPEGGSVFHGSAQSREDIANFLMGYINGHQDAARLASTPAQGGE